MATLSELSEALTQSIEAASQSVVRLRGTRFPACGTVWAPDEVVTVAHVLGRRDKGVVVLPSGDEAQAEVIGRDRSTDLALLKIDAKLTVPSWSDDVPKVGNLVLAVGQGRHKGPRATLGMVGGVGGAWKTRAGGEIDAYIEVDASLPHGFSGGPLVGADGSVHGINSHRLMRSGITIPTTTIRRVTQHLAEHGAFRRGYLGVGVQAVALPDAVAAELGRKRGVLVTSVADDAPAAGAGVLLGDVILALDGIPITGLEDLLAALATRAGTKAKLELLRAGARESVDVEIGER